MRPSLLLALAACLRTDDTDTSGETDTAADTDPAPPGAWSFPAVSDGDVRFARACESWDPETWAFRWNVVGWFEGTATFGAAPNVVLVADGVDGVLVELDAEGELQRVVPFGGPGDQRALDCEGTFVTGTSLLLESKICIVNGVTTPSQVTVRVVTPPLVTGSTLVIFVSGCAYCFDTSGVHQGGSS